MENSARIVCILAPSIRHARIPETPDRRRATASLRTLRNARRTNDIILTTSIPSLPNCSANSSMDRLSSRLEREWPETSNFSNFPSPRLLFQRIGSKKASGVFKRVLNQRRKEGREGIFSTHRGCIAPRVAISRETRLRGEGVSEFVAQAPDS